MVNNNNNKINSNDEFNSDKLLHEIREEFKETDHGFKTHKSNKGLISRDGIINLSYLNQNILKEGVELDFWKKISPKEFAENFKLKTSLHDRKLKAFLINKEAGFDRFKILSAFSYIDIETASIDLPKGLFPLIIRGLKYKVWIAPIDLKIFKAKEDF